MSRIGEKFRELAAQNHKAFIPYIMAGDPSLKRTEKIVGILEDCGADIVELGVPFSDPLADGPTIQMAAQRALLQGVTLHQVIELVGSIRIRTQMPIVLMTYYNPVFRYGEERFVNDAVSSGVDGVIIPDLPPDEASPLIRHARHGGLDTIFLLAPTSTNSRIKKVSRASRGFIYYVSMTGITGARLAMDSAISSSIAKIRKISSMPVAVGFGISTPKEASGVAQFADGVIVGSAVVKKVHSPDKDLRSYVLSLRKAIR